MLALAALSQGIVWSSCSPDFGVDGVIDRFGQIEPKVLFVADGYLYNGKQHDVLERVRSIAERLPSLRKVVVVPYLDRAPGRRRHSQGGAAGGVAAPAHAGRHRLGAAAVRSSRLYPFHLGDHGQAEVHRARRGRDAACGAQDVQAAVRRAAGRPFLLLHHLQLGDVEPAVPRARRGSDHHAL
jgi:hypothetical protein